MVAEVVMQTKEVVVWKCPNGHGLGVVIENGSGVRQLALYRDAVDIQAEIPEDVDVLGLVVGKMEIRCSACGELRTWYPDSQTRED